MKIQFNGFEIKIIWHLHRHKYYGNKHTSVDNLRKGFLKHSGRDIDDAIYTLIQEGIIIKQKKTKEDHVSLNSMMIPIIHQVTDWFPNNSKSIDKEKLKKIYFEIET